MGGLLLWFSGFRFQHCRELWCRSQMQLGLALLWLWHRLAAVAPIGPLTWEPPYAAGVALEKTKKKKRKKSSIACSMVCCETIQLYLIFFFFFSFSF